MSYSRMGKKCDISLFSGDRYLCLGCKLQKDINKEKKQTPSTTFKTEEEMLVHLIAHKRCGHKVPFHVVKGIWNMVKREKL